MFTVPPKAIYTLDLVALMAGEKFQQTANHFIENMELHARAETTAASTTTVTATPRRHVITVSPCDSKRSPRETKTGGRALKKSRRDYSLPEVQGESQLGGVRRVRCPSLDVFQREYMETATPVILTEVIKQFSRLVFACRPVSGILYSSIGSGNSSSSFCRKPCGRVVIREPLTGCRLACATVTYSESIMWEIPCAVPFIECTFFIIGHDTL